MMNKKFKVLVYGGASISLLASLLAGCGTSNNNSSGNVNSSNNSQASDSSSNNAAASNSATTEDKPDHLTFWAYYPDQNKVDSPGVTALAKKFNAEIELVPTSGDTYKEDVNLKIASGNIPDWIKEPAPTDYMKFVDQGVVAEIPQDMIEKYMPKYVEWIKRFIDKDDPFKYVRVNGKIYGLPGIWDIGIDGQQLGFREDWLKKVGINKIPETIEEEEAALTKFRNDDPDGNGKKDTYGITATAESLDMMFSSVFGAYDAYPGIFREKDGKIVRGEIEPGAKQALTTLNRWYANGLIDPEFVVNKGNNFEDKMLTGKAGAADYYWWVYYPGNAFLGGETWYDKLHKVDPNFKWLTEGGIKGPEGKFGISQSSPNNASGLMFGKQLADDQEKLGKYLQIFEATQFEPEFYELLNFGVKGTHWQLNEHGVVEYIAPYDNEDERKKLGIAGGYSMAGSFNDYDFQTSYTADKDLRPIAQEARAKGVKVYDILNAYQKPLYNENKDQLTQFTLQSYIDFITGKKPIDDFDKFVEDWNKMGGEKVMTEAQQVYDQHK
ncbi:extracellular solute-binding protein [Paenibacillus sp. CF384]|uniref:extracellular solute-binding protein n=1 Tax=Paenibacillus sp. CF384 TaxID=1884382 RepID=UPI000896D02A|nr:extracellular solute-binding protein [Paenibacillus sp. CF384]SDX97688.1 putative aldouronate transport system substrate-binding protein [Paenibacillus sp. CF384]